MRLNQKSQSQTSFWWLLLLLLLLLGFCLYIINQKYSGSTVSSNVGDSLGPGVPPVNPTALDLINQKKPPKNKQTKLKEAKAKINLAEVDLPFDPTQYIENFEFLDQDDLRSEKAFFELIGLQTEKDLLNNFIQTIKTPSELINYQQEPLKGCIFYGAPGNGKTTLARALAKELGFKYLEIDGTIFQKFNQKEGIEMVEALFFWIQKYAPVVVCIDECETPFKNLNQTTDQNMKNIVTKFKNNWTGLKYQPDKPIFFIGTTNHLEDVDTAILSRFDYKIEVKSFDLPARKAFLKKYAETQLIHRDALKTESKIQPAAIAYLDTIAEKLEAFPSLQSIRQLKGLFKKAAILAIKRYYQNPAQEENKISQSDLQQALEADINEAHLQNTFTKGKK